MTQKLTNDWSNEFDIDLIALSNYGDTTRRMGLRELSLYLDINKDGQLSLNEDAKGWDLHIYEYQEAYHNSCFYYDKHLADNTILAIDTFHRRGKEDDYAIQVYIRPDESKDIAFNDNRLRGFFKKNPLKGYEIKTYGDGTYARYEYSGTFTRALVIEEIKKLLSKVWEA